jgi:hypothetical protein
MPTRDGPSSTRFSRRRLSSRDNRPGVRPGKRHARTQATRRRRQNQYSSSCWRDQRHQPCPSPAGASAEPWECNCTHAAGRGSAPRSAPDHHANQCTRREHAPRSVPRARRGGTRSREMRSHHAQRATAVHLGSRCPTLTWQSIGAIERNHRAQPSSESLGASRDHSRCASRSCPAGPR